MIRDARTRFLRPLLLAVTLASISVVRADDAMDRLWWDRIAALCKEHTAISEKIRAKERDIREETSAAFKKDLLAEKKVLDDELAKIQMHLTADMAYTGTEVPPIDNKEVMTRLREERDKDKYGAWKISTLKYTKSHRGAMLSRSG